MTAVGLVLCAAGASFCLLGAFGEAGRLAGLAVAIAGVLLASPSAREPAPWGRWWQASVLGIIVALAGIAIGLASGAIGGILVAGGSITAIAGALLGPMRWKRWGG